MNRILSAAVHDENGLPGAGLKRQMFRQTFTGCDLLVGPNGAGKTTRGPLVITAALEGLASVPTDPRRPYVGGLPEATAVTLEVQTRGGVEYLTRDLSVSRGRLVQEADQRARDLVGIPPTAWDLRDFASGTDGDRGKILDAVARAGGAIERWDATRAQEHVRGLLVGAADEDVDIDAWCAPLAAAVEALTTAPDGATWLQAAQTWAEAQQRTTNAAQKEAAGHLGELTQSVPDAPGGDETADDAARRDLHRREAALEASAEEVTRAEAARTRHDQEGQRLRDQMEATQAEGSRLKVPIPAPDTTIPAEVTRRLEQAQAATTAPVGDYDGPDSAALQAAATEAERGAVAARSDVGAAEKTEIATCSTANDAAQKAARLAADLRAARASISALEAASGQGHATCRHCRGEDPLGIIVQLQEERTQAAALAGEADKAERTAEEAKAAHKAAVAALGTARDALRAAETTATNAAARVRAAAEARAGHADTVRARRQRELDAAQAELDREARRATERTAAWERAEKQREADLQAARQRWAAARDALQAWEATEPPAVPAPPSEEERATIARELDEVDARIEARREHKAHLARIKAATDKYQAAKLRWDATRALVAALRQARDDVAAAAYNPIDKAARELVEGSEGLPVPYFAGPSDYGAVVPGRGRVPYAGLSESEQRITAAALVYALATVAGCPCRLVLVDGIEVVQRDHRGPLIAALARAQREGRVDSVVLTMATAPGEEVEPIEGCTIHEIERVGTERAVPATAPEPKLAVAGGCPF